MKPVFIFLPLCALGILPALAQSAPEAVESTARPLNLSLPRDVARSPAVSFDTAAPRDPVTDNLRSAQVRGGPERLPYGSGYEARRQGMAGREAGAASGGASSGSGHGGLRGGGGGGGRGGMGRGR
jgi:hypothetical protein